MKVLIVEDEIHAAERLKKLLTAIDPAIETLAACDSVESSVKWLKNNQEPDLIFMDIEIAAKCGCLIGKQDKELKDLAFN